MTEATGQSFMCQSFMCQSFTPYCLARIFGPGLRQSMRHTGARPCRCLSHDSSVQRPCMKLVVWAWLAGTYRHVSEKRAHKPPLLKKGLWCVWGIQSKALPFPPTKPRRWHPPTSLPPFWTRCGKSISGAFGYSPRPLMPLARPPGHPRDAAHPSREPVALPHPSLSCLPLAMLRDDAYQWVTKCTCCPTPDAASRSAWCSRWDTQVREFLEFQSDVTLHFVRAHCPSVIMATLISRT